MAYAPQISGSSIVWVTSSIQMHTTVYTSSNKTLQALGQDSGSFTGPELHLKFLDTSVSGSHSFYGPWTGSWTYYTESGANSHGIPANSESIFTSSYGISQSSMLTENLGFVSESHGFIMTFDDDGNLTMQTTESAADTIAFYVSKSGAIGIGTTTPGTSFEVAGTSNLAKLASPAFTGRITAPDCQFTQMTSTGITCSDSLGMKGNLNGNALSATNATNATNVTTAADSGNATHYVTFVDAAAATQQLKTDNGLTYNPNTNLLSATTVCANTLVVGAGTDEEGTQGPILYSLDQSPDGGCESIYACEDIEIDCARKGIWINGGLISHDRGTFTFTYDGKSTTIKVIGK